MNRWQRWFFDALERKDVETAASAVILFIVIVAAMAAIGVMIVRARETLQVRWREWIVKQSAKLWLGGNRFYHLSTRHNSPDNPEYRIADDSRWATEPLVDLAIGLFSSLVGAAAFISILWQVGGALTFSILGLTLVIPAYMVLAALVYGGVMSGLMMWIGKPLIACVARKNAAEGEFRFSLMRLRENAESIAMMNGAQAEDTTAERVYDAVVTRWLEIVRQHCNLTWVTNASGPMIPIFPLLCAAPKYLSGELSLGEVIQLGAAFVQVQLAISWLVDNYLRVAEWLASARRVMDLVDASQEVDRELAAVPDKIEVARDTGDDVSIKGLSVRDVGGQEILNCASLDIPHGTLAEIYGGTSSGKTLVARALSGLWPWGRGHIRLPEGERTMFVPQRSYNPIGTLRDVLHYPSATKSISDAKLIAALTDFGLEHLIVQLDLRERWDQVLGNSERQRLAIARVAIHQPEVAVLDDAFSAIDEHSREALIAVLRRWLPACTIIHLGSYPLRTSLDVKTFELTRHGAVSALQPAAAPA
jgi:putative ATP-binding cassette transporter